MIQEKTRGNLTNEESAVLRNTLSNLQMAFVEVSRNAPGTSTPPAPTSEAPPEPAETSPEIPSSPATPSENESKKKFTKSYGG
jgi:hypothetical protein